MTEACENCRFHFVGLCRRNPPTLIDETPLNKDARFWRSVFPEVVPRQWCGEYKPQPDEAVRAFKASE